MIEVHHVEPQNRPSRRILSKKRIRTFSGLVIVRVQDLLVPMLSSKVRKLRS